MSRTTIVTRRYSIKLILSRMPEWLRIKKLAELDDAWGTQDTDYANRLINSIVGKGPRLGEDRLVAATKVLDATAEEITTPFQEVTRRSVKIAS